MCPRAAKSFLPESPRHGFWVTHLERFLLGQSLDTGLISEFVIIQTPVDLKLTLSLLKTSNLPGDDLNYLADDVFSSP